ncbi:DUF1801 domain-containing protein [Caulobacter sp. 73W]|uniref:DUF1801 domain-containing protein n=1 Tax=Caulobacter sp. 73W TaxID=3161137 RepID=A0AB39KNY0_9CAUL
MSTAIDDYLAKLPADQRQALEDLRRRIHAAVPGLTEVISYGLPGFKLDGVLVWMGAAKAHCAFYPHGLVEEYADRLTGFETSKGAIRFQPDALLPADLVREIVQRRAGEDRERTAARKAGRKKA